MPLHYVKFYHRDHKVIHRAPQRLISQVSQSVKISIDEVNLPKSVLTTKCVFIKKLLKTD
jgi:hypothetical protein